VNANQVIRLIVACAICVAVAALVIWAVRALF
jgi:hypothetical protein